MFGIESNLNMREEKIIRDEKEWKEKLTPEQYRVLREKGTETPFTGKYLHTKDKGIYKCAACGNELFSSETKFDSGTGWPSFTPLDVSRPKAADVAPKEGGHLTGFTDPSGINMEGIELKDDISHGMVRDEVLCKNCGSHLGHVFDDGHGENGERYCINSVCLELETDNK